MRYLALVAVVAGLVGLGIFTPRQEAGAALGQERPLVVRVPQDFPTIQAAVEAVAEGGTVLLGPGVYKENLTITKSVRLIGAGQERVQLQYSDPERPIIDILPGSAIALQVHMQDLTIGDPAFPILAGKGLEIFAPIHLVLRRVVIAGLAHGVTGIARTANYPYWDFPSQIILEEVSLVRNGVGLYPLGVQIVTSRSKIEENIVGIVARDLILLVQSSIRKNRHVGVALAISGLGESSKIIGHVVESEFMQNGIGMILAAGAEGHSIFIWSNRFAQNEKYAIVVQDPSCPIRTPLLLLPSKSAPIWVEGQDNEFHDNGQDLCPPDYPWPPGFRK